MFTELLIIIPALLQANGWLLMHTQVLDQEEPESILQFGPEDLEYEENPTELKDMAIIRMLRKRTTAAKWRMKRGSVGKEKIRILKRSDIGNIKMSQIVDG